MKYLKYLVLLIAILGYFGYVYAQSNTEVDRIDPVYDRDWYARYGYFHYAAYYVYGEVKGWYVLRGSPGYYRTEHYGFASMGVRGDHVNYIDKIKVCGKAFDSDGNLLNIGCAIEYSDDGGMTSDAYLVYSFFTERAFKAQTKVTAYYIHKHGDTVYATHKVIIPYSYIEVNY